MLIGHPFVNKIYLASRGEAGKAIAGRFQNRSAKIHSQYLAPDDKILLNSQVVFFATPNLTALNSAQNFINAGIKVIDLSADFRLKNIAVFKKWYGAEHNQPELLEKAVYGLCEVYKDKIAQAQLIANPGCYATATQLALFPGLSHKLFSANIIADAKSGTSGAGKKLEEAFLYCEVNENLRAYAISGHRHHPEIVANLNSVCESGVNLTFVPHLIPMQRGILVTIYTQKNPNITNEQIINVYREYYKQAKFVRVLDYGKTPATADVCRSNFCDIGIFVNEENNMVIITSVIDNMVKGAGGQAIQNMNLMMGFAEDAGLL